MDEDKSIQTTSIPIPPQVYKELVESKENIPDPPKKIRFLPWIVLFSVASFTVLAGGLIIKNQISDLQAPDLIVNAESVVHSQITPLPTEPGQVAKLVSQESLLEQEPYRDETARFEIKAPVGWIVDDLKKTNDSLMFIDPKVVYASGSAILTFINVSSKPVTSTFETIIQSSKETLIKLYDSYTFEEDKTMIINGNSWYLIGGIYKVKNTIMKNRNLIMISNNYGYSIAATAPESVWSEKEMLINASLFSFKTF